MREFPSKAPFYFLVEIKVFCFSGSSEEQEEWVGADMGVGWQLEALLILVNCPGLFIPGQ